MFLGTAEGHIEEAAFLGDGGGFAGMADRDEAVFKAAQVDRGPFQPLGGVEGGHLDRVDGFVNRRQGLGPY